ncbi:PEP-CTERM sorting domain-containing protein [Luteolibacter sp. SL250]|uniref:PEP-CTERM sorting domain-containing protein n=1 Tax=Luteolibacter sp. SL250 TaxID=2995170 RepID=UPI002270B8B8|nr:PEP-CTERM sorting domain-containing protein [Luteolibacter sp. SL250]WAC18377.1 PEP-CTERM sorting domain-containing protein [Luteolibacter sp. SL250]
MNGKPFPIPFVLPICAACISVSGTASGAVLANYAFASGSATSTDTDITSTASNISLTNGDNTGTTTGTGGVTGAGISSSSHMFYFRTSGLKTNEGDAVTAPDYISFTFTPTAGTSYNLQTITLDFGGSNAGGSAPGYTSYAFLRSSLGDTPYSTNIGSTISRDVPGPGAGDVYNLAQETFTFTDPAFANVTAPVTFRLYMYASSNAESLQILRLDNLRLNGAAVPEPASALALALSLGTTVLRRRR